jgi:Holliday junction DNA helicase RuvA
MISYVTGILAEIDDDCIVVESGGVGFEILTYSSVIEHLPDVGAEVKIVTYMDVKEDDIRLFGFLSNQEKKLFKQLLTVSGVGPKGALSILDQLGPDNLVAAIISSDSKSISKANGIGSKTAQKVCLELRDKVSIEGTIYEKYSDSSGAGTEASSGVIGEAVEALCALGYSKSDAMQAVRKIDGASSMKPEAIVSKALRLL